MEPRFLEWRKVNGIFTRAYDLQSVGAAGTCTYLLTGNGARPQTFSVYHYLPAPVDGGKRPLVHLNKGKRLREHDAKLLADRHWWGVNGWTWHDDGVQERSA